MRASASSHLSQAHVTPHAAQANNAGKTDEASAFDQLVASTEPQEKKPAQNDARTDKPASDKAAAPDFQPQANAAPKPAITQDNKAPQDIQDEKPADVAGDIAPVIEAQAGDPALIAQPVTQPIVQPAVVAIPVMVAAANEDTAAEESTTAPTTDAPAAPADPAQDATPQAAASQTPAAAPQAGASTDAKPAAQNNADHKAPQVAESQAAEPATRKPQEDVTAKTDNAPADPAKPELTQAATVETAAPKSAAQPAPGTNMAVHAAQQPQAAAAPAAMAEVTKHVEVSAEPPKPNMPSLAVEIAAKSLSGARQFDIRLDPPELGRVEVRLSIDAAGKASAHLSADQPQTLDLLQRDASILTRALRDAGLDVSQNSLNFSLRHQNHDGAAHRGHARGSSRGTTLNATSNVEATPASTAWRGDGRLDIRV